MGSRNWRSSSRRKAATSNWVRFALRVETVRIEDTWPAAPRSRCLRTSRCSPSSCPRRQASPSRWCRSRRAAKQRRGWAGVGLEITRDQRIYCRFDKLVRPRQQHGLTGERVVVEEKLTGCLGRGRIEARGQIIGQVIGDYVWFDGQ